MECKFFVAFEVCGFCWYLKAFFDSSLFDMFARSHQESGCLEFGHETLYWHILPPMNTYLLDNWSSQIFLGLVLWDPCYIITKTLWPRKKL